MNFAIFQLLLKLPNNFNLGKIKQQRHGHFYTTPVSQKSILSLITKEMKVKQIFLYRANNRYELTRYITAWQFVFH